MIEKYLIMAAGSNADIGDGYDITNATYDNKSLALGSEDLGARGFFIGNSGSNIVIAGDENDAVFQYNLSTAYDVSTGSYSNLSFDISTQDTVLTDVFFNDDGSRMFIVGRGSDSIYQYTVSSPWSINTASYDSVSLSVSSQENSPTGIAFSSDGSKMYVVGLGSRRVRQYTLSTAWDLSTASYDNVSFLVTGETFFPRALTVDNSGTRMLVCGESSVFQYTLSTPNDISTASYDSVSLDISSQGVNCMGAKFNNDGTILYALSFSGDAIFQYSL